MTLEVGKRYRCKITGVVGISTALEEDEDGRKQVQLSLEAIHLEDGDMATGMHPKAANNRWYVQSRLEEITDGEKVI